jgi:hypothetical protein
LPILLSSFTDKALPYEEREGLSFLDNPLTSAGAAGEVVIYITTGAFTIWAFLLRPSKCNAAFSITGRAGKPFMRMNATTFTKCTLNHRLIDLNLPRTAAYLTAGYLRQQIEGVLTFTLTKRAFYLTHKLNPPPISHLLNPLLRYQGE